MAPTAYYKCIVEGDYFAGIQGSEVIRRYNLIFKVPDLGPDKSDTHYMSVIKKNLLTKQLKAKYQDAITFRTHEMVDRVYCTGANQPAPQTPPQVPQPQKNPSSMNKNELIAYITNNKYPIDLEIYSTVDKMRKAIATYNEDTTAFLKEQADLKAEIELQKTLSDLNPLPTEGEGSQANVDPNYVGTEGEGTEPDNEQ